MYVKTFKADRLDEAMAQIKSEMGPDAIILKTVTNKGLKGVMKKKKIEITAAISEKKFGGKLKVDKAITDDNKEKFYNQSSSYISKMIDQYVPKKEEAQGPQSSLGFDEFINEEPKVDIREDITPKSHYKPVQNNDLEDRIVKLEKKFYSPPHEFYKIRNYLLSCGINEEFTRKILGGLGNDIQEEESLEKVVGELKKVFRITPPLFLDDSRANSITILISEEASGQTSLMYKMGFQKKYSSLIQYGSHKEGEYSLTEKILERKTEKVENLSSLMTLARKNLSEQKSLLIDFRDQKNDQQCFNVIDSLKKTFENVEVLLVLSCIKNELNNKKMIHQYSRIINGVIYTFYDQCLLHGSLFNIFYENKALPLKGISQGRNIPESFEIPSDDKLLGKLFHV